MSRLKLKWLLSKLKAGKKEYFEEFYTLTKGAVWYVARKYVRERFFAEDIVQDSYISFLNNLSSVKGDPLPYLCSIAKNKALDSIKKESGIDKSVTPEDLQFAVSDDYATEAPLLETCRKNFSEEEFLFLKIRLFTDIRGLKLRRCLKNPFQP